MNCPKCRKSPTRKSGKTANGKQRFFCKPCDYHFSVKVKDGGGTKEQKKVAFKMIKKGKSFRFIGRELGFSHNTIIRWWREFKNKKQWIKKAR